MNRRISRRTFSKCLIGSAAGLALPGPVMAAAKSNSFSFLLVGDLHYDQLRHHDLEVLGRTKPDDLRQVREYSSFAENIQPRLFQTLGATVKDSKRTSAPVAFVAHVGDLVEGLCMSDVLALRQDTDAIDMVRCSKLGVPFVFAKGNHDITGPGAEAAFKEVFHPFLNEQRKSLKSSEKLSSAFYAFEHANALFCFFDAYDRASLDWLEATLQRRTARHCFLIVHPPVVPYGARATWHLYSSEKDKPRREHLLELLGSHNAMVLTGHIHKYNALVRRTPTRGQFAQLAISSVIRDLETSAADELNGVEKYNGDQISVEPHFSPATKEERRAVYSTEAPLVTQFEYADLPGYALVTVEGEKVTAKIFSGVSRKLWRTLLLSKWAGAQA